MKKIISLVLACVLLIGCVCVFASCGKVNENYAEKINKAADKDEHLTYEEVKKDLGDNVVTDAVAFGVGFVVAVKGCESWDDVEDKFDNDETVKGLYISIFNNKAVSAEYREITPDDKD